MNKHSLVCAWAFTGIFYSFGTDFSTATIKKGPFATPSLQAFSTKQSFYFKNDTEKEAINKKLKEDQSFRESLRFDGLIIENLDLSEMYLKDINFSGGTFIHVNFNNADLTGAIFNKSKLDRADLTGAILCPLDHWGHPISDKTFTIKSRNHYQLVKQYSDLMKESKVDQAQCLNKLFPALYLDLFDEELKKFNLIDINLENTNLLLAKLQGAILSKNVTVPDCPEYNYSQLFKLWCGENPEYQQAYQKLVNARFNITQGVDHNTLIEGLKKKKDLRNAHLMNANLQGADLTGTNLQNANLMFAKLKKVNLTEANLQNADLMDAKLQGANLTGANLENANLMTAKLQGAILSKNVTVPDYPVGYCSELFKLWCGEDPEYQQAYQSLVNARFYITIRVDHNTLIEGLKKKKDLKNATLCRINLQSVDLTDANLQNADLQNTDLQNADLTGANLQGANLKETKLSGARLSISWKLPENCKDEDLIEIYKSCTDEKAKPILKQILERKDIPLE